MNNLTLKDLLDKLKIYNPDEVGVIERAYEYADTLHQGQVRQSGEPYISHPLNVVYILTNMHADRDTICAGLLHDTLEDTNVTKEDIAHDFNQNVANLVDGVTKLSKMNFSSKQDQNYANTRKIITGIAEDVRIIIIKLADRLHNMRTLEFKSEFKQKENALETIEIFVPLAYYIGAYRIKSELEDLSLKYLKPDMYKRIEERKLGLEESSNECLKEILYKIKALLNEKNIPNEIKVRTKNIYGIYKKLNEGHKLSDIHDLLALKIMVDEVANCYYTLGMIHQEYHPINGKFKDYICNPKTNMYQSLHTTVFGPDDRLVQTQVRTFNMDKVASFGLTVYWDEQKGKARDVMQDDLKQKFQFFNSLIEINSMFGDNQQFVNQIKTELFADRIYVYTTKGDIIELPKGATPIDFAYSIHQHVAESMVGAKINGKIVPITTKLKNTDVVEIITSKTASGPKLDWIKSIKTNSAKNKIVSYLKKQSKESNIQKGMESFEKEASKFGIPMDELMAEKYLKPMLAANNFNTVEEMYENIGFGVLSVKKAANRIYEEYKAQNKIEEEKTETNIQKSRKSNFEGVEVEGIDNCLVKFAKCCNPIPGDDIIGYISYGKGVSIHRADCPNLVGLDIEQRRIGVKWKTKENAEYETKIIILANDRPNLGLDILKLLQEMKIRITGFTARTTKNNQCAIDVSVETSSVDELQRIIKGVRKIDSVFEVKRAK